MLVKQLPGSSDALHANPGARLLLQLNLLLDSDDNWFNHDVKVQTINLEQRVTAAKTAPVDERS